MARRTSNWTPSRYMIANSCGATSGNGSAENPRCRRYHATVAATSRTRSTGTENRNTASRPAGSRRMYSGCRAVTLRARALRKLIRVRVEESGERSFACGCAAEDARDLHERVLDAGRDGVGELRGAAPI